MPKKDELVTGYCLYFLFDKSEIIYIGQTGDLRARLHSHKDKKFTNFRAILCAPEDLNRYEERWIKKFKPTHNKQYRSHHSRFMCSDVETDNIKMSQYLKYKADMRAK